MHRFIVLNFGQGDLLHGFPVVTAQFWDSERTGMQFTGSLPAMASLDTLFQRWRLLYESFYLNFGWRTRKTGVQIPDFEIDEDDDNVTNISHAEFQNVCRELQVQFNRWLSAGSFLNIERKLRTHLTPKDEVYLIIVAPLSTLTLPWCLWDFLSDYPGAEIALSPPEYARAFKTDKPIGATTKNYVKILSILGNSTGINISQDQEVLQKLPDAEITFLTEPTSQQLNDQLWESEWDILFFAGHSSSQGQGCIQINSEEALTIEQLKYGLRKAISNGLKLAIFNSCDGLGLAADLADLHLPQIIVMREPVPDKVAQEFLKYFLGAFSVGKSLYISVKEAREKLQGLEVQFPCATWLPVICQNPAEIPSTWVEWCGNKNKIQLFPPRRLLKKIAVSSLVSTLFVTGIRFLGLLSPVELSAFDMLTRARIPESPDDRILVVTVTSEDIQAQTNEPRFGSLSDTTLNRLLVKLQNYQPAAIGLDIYRDYKSQSELALQLQRPNIIGVCKRPDGQDDLTGILPPPEIPASQLGFSDFVQDNDGAIRRHLLFMTPRTTSRCTAAYALNTRLAIEYLYTQHNIKAEYTPDGYLKLGKIIFPSIGARTSGYQSVDAGGSQILVNYRATSDPESIAQKVTLKDIFSEKVNPEAIKNRIILIGRVGSDAEDYWPTPYGAGSSNKIPGVFVHAHMTSQIISTVLDNRPLIWVWSTWQEILWTFGWSFIGGFIAWRCGKILIMGAVVCGSIVILITTCWLLLNYGGWIPLVPPLLVFMLDLGAVAFLLLSDNWQRIQRM